MVISVSDSKSSSGQSGDKKDRHNSKQQVEKTMRELINNNKGLKNEKIGRPTKYTEEIGAEICLRICEGESLNSIVRDAHMPNKSTVIRWAMFSSDCYHFADEELREKITVFSDHYAYARMVQAENLIDECTDICDDGTNDWTTKELKNSNKIDVPNHEHISRSKLRVETRKWLGEVYLPKVQALRDKNLNLKTKQPIILQFDKQDEEA